jgi:hypothetical protein
MRTALSSSAITMTVLALQISSAMACATSYPAPSERERTDSSGFLGLWCPVPMRLEQAEHELRHEKCRPGGHFECLPG